MDRLPFCFSICFFVMPPKRAFQEHSKTTLIEEFFCPMFVCFFSPNKKKATKPVEVSFGTTFIFLCQFIFSQMMLLWNNNLQILRNNPKRWAFGTKVPSCIRIALLKNECESTLETKNRATWMLQATCLHLWLIFLILVFPMAFLLHMAPTTSIGCQHPWALKQP